LDGRDRGHGRLNTQKQILETTAQVLSKYIPQRAHHLHHPGNSGGDWVFDLGSVNAEEHVKTGNLELTVQLPDNPVIIYAMLLYVLFSAFATFRETRKKVTNDLGPQSIDTTKSSERILLELLIIILTGLGVAYLIAVLALISSGGKESAFFLGLCPAILLGGISAILVGRHIRKKAISQPTGLLLILGSWVILVWLITGDDILTEKSFF
jgi:hypothetical protein